MTDYRTLKTNQGLSLEAAAETGGKAITLTTLVVGDGGGNDVIPDARQTALIREVTRVKLNTVTQKEGDAAQWVAEAVIPADNGGYTVREVGLLTDEGVLFAVGNFPATYKPRPDEGTAGQLTVTMNFKAQNADNITLMIDGNVAVATRQWVGNQLGAVMKQAEEEYAQAVSGVAGLADGDHQGLSLHTRGSDNAVLYGDVANGSRALALTSDVQAESQAQQSALADEIKRARAAEAALQPRGPYVPSAPRDGHNDSTVNNLIYDNNNGGKVAVSVVDVGVISLQTADDYALSSDVRSVKAALSSETQRAQAAEAALQPRGPYVPSAPRDGHNDSAVNNLIYDNNNGGNVAVSVQGKGLTWLQAADDYALSSDVRSVKDALSSETQRAQAAEAGLQPRGDYALNSALAAERERAEAAESQFIPSLPRSGKSDITINNAAFDTSTGRPWVSVVGTGVLEMLTTNDISSSLNQSGYFKLPGGLIFQWGWTQNSNATFTFPIKFPNRCFIVLPGNTDAQGQFVDNAYGWPVNNAEFFLATKSSNGSVSGFSCAWMAIGF